MFLDDIAARLVAAGVGTIGADIFLGSKATIPTGDGPYISLTETGGTAPLRTHNDADPGPTFGTRTPSVPVRRPSAQILARAKSYKDARTKSEQAYAVLQGAYNITINGTKYHSITADQEPTDIGLDAEKRPMISFNIQCEKN